MSGGSGSIRDLEQSIKLAKVVLRSGGFALDLVATADRDVTATAVAVARNGSATDVTGLLIGSRLPLGDAEAEVWNWIVDGALYAMATVGIEAGPEAAAHAAADRSAIAVRALTSADGHAYGRTTMEADDVALDRLLRALQRRGGGGDLTAAIGAMWLDAAGRSGRSPVAVVGAPEPWWMAPGPFEWKLPVTFDACPVPAFEAWWSALVIRPEPSPPPLAVLRGTRLSLSTPADDSDPWGKGSVSQRGALAEIRPDELRFVFTAFVPGAEGAAPTPVDIGFRLALATIEAIELRMSFPTTRPLLGPAKSLVDARGYQACSGYHLSIECSDGFATRRVVLTGDHLPVDREVEPKAAFDHAVAAIAADRVTQPGVTDTDRGLLARGFATSAPPAEERRGKGTNAYLHQTWRWQPPAPRPVSVRS